MGRRRVPWNAPYEFESSLLYKKYVVEALLFEPIPNLMTKNSICNNLSIRITLLFSYCFKLVFKFGGVPNDGGWTTYSFINNAQEDNQHILIHKTGGRYP